MAAAPAESSGSHGKGQELSQSYSSSGLDYSGDTFESFSEEEEEESKPSGSCCSTEDLEGSAVSEALESTSSLAGQSHAVPAELEFTESQNILSWKGPPRIIQPSWNKLEDRELIQNFESPCATLFSTWINILTEFPGALEQPQMKSPCRAGKEESEGVDSAAMERDAIGKWIDAMGKWIDVKNKGTEIKPDKSVIKTPAEIPELFSGELDALRSFCSTKIRRMHQELANGGKSRKLQRGIPARKTEAGDWRCVVPTRLMNRILLENTRETVKQVTEAQIHEPSACPECQQKEAELAKIAFLRQKKTLLEGALIQQKLEEQLYSRDVLTLIGEALRSFPKPSEDPRDLWQRLKADFEDLWQH